MSEGSSSWWRYAAATAAAGVTVAGGLYLYNRVLSEDEEETKPKAPKLTLKQPTTLNMARNIQAKAMLAPKPKPKPAAAKPAARAGPGGAGLGGGRKLCARCNQPSTGLPQRCSQCKAVYYCSAECQKLAWPDHKLVCKAANKGGKAGEEAEAAAADSSSKGDTEPESTSAAPAKAPATVEQALAEYLAESASSKSDPLEALFELSVMMFLRGDYRGAMAQLEATRAMAREQGVAAVEGEVYKWLGHCHNKLGDPSKATAHFEAGCYFAKQHGLAKLEIDCLGGLGVTARGQADAEGAIKHLQKAFDLAKASDDSESQSAMLCNLGAAMMSKDQAKGIQLLEQAVEMREAAVELHHAQGNNAGLASAVMEHAAAVVNLASAYYVAQRYSEAKEAYQKALEVFEIVEDVDKVAKVLINLANMAELQLKQPSEAAEYRAKLGKFLQEHELRGPVKECAICLEPIKVEEASPADQELIVLACFHCFHNRCWTKHCEGKEAVQCPTCRQPVTLFDKDEAPAEKKEEKKEEEGEGQQGQQQEQSEPAAPAAPAPAEPAATETAPVASEVPAAESS